MIKVIFFGTEDISVPTLRSLIDSNQYEVVGVVTKPDSIRGRGHRLDSPAVAKLAKANDIPLFQPTRLQDVEVSLKQLQPDVGALVSYGKIVPQSTIDLFPHGIINFHPSMLPVYRGPSPIETAIINGDSFTGLTLMSLTKEMDAGPIWYQEKTAINPDDTSADLYNRFGRRGAELMVNKLDQIVEGKLKPVDQEDDMAIYCHMIKKSDGDLDPSIMTGRDCYNRLRALSKWPKCRISIKGHVVIVTDAQPLDHYAGEAWPDIIPCYSESALQIKQIINPKSGRKMTVTDYLNGLKNKL